MGQVAVDFGTCNTVIARFNEATQQAETIEIPEITRPYVWQGRPGDTKHVVHVTPSLIHYSPTATLIGNQVSARGLAEHPDTFRWMKRAIAQHNTRVRNTPYGFKNAAQAGDDFLSTLLKWAGDRISFEHDEFTFTAPVEAFEDFQDWLLRVTESLGIRRVRLQDEPTACVFGYMGMARRNDRFVVFDFGGGTLDVSAVRLELEPGQDPKAVQLGAAGEELGGVDIDRWLLEDFCERHRLNGTARQELETYILRQAEEAKIRLSNPSEEDATISVVNKYGAAPRVHSTAYTARCPACAPGTARPRKDTGDACLGCILLRQGFAQRVRETVDRALENAAVRTQMRRADVTRVLVTGGTSLAPPVRRLLVEMFGERVFQDRPF
ncbi:MAG TPA: Hsp70 family protein, partial [Candidatus Hydrogenedentes bacterium]|nr:Hsp70 family protein [Candidatus Hydrogenedentota bacterium]